MKKMKDVSHNLIRRMTALTLTMTLTIPLAACGSTNKTDSDTPSYVYIPEFLQIEDAESISWYDTRLADNALYYTTYAWDEETSTSTQGISRYSLTDQSVETLPLALTQGNFSDWVIGADGSIYAVLYTWDTDEYGNMSRSSNLAKYDPQGSEAYNVGIDNLFEDEYSSVRYLEVDDQGRVYVFGDQKIWLFDENGNHAGNVDMLSATGRGYVNSCGRGVDGKVYACITSYTETESTTSLIEIDYDLKALGQSYENFPSGSGNGRLVQSAEGKFLVNNGASVSEYDLETQQKQVMLNWLDCDINGSRVRSFGMLSDGRLAAVYQDWETNDSGVALLTRTSSNQVVQKKQIVIGTLSESNSDIQAAAVAFNRSNEEYHVTIRGYADMDNWSQDAYRDALSRMNSDMTSNNCPDIIDLTYVDVNQLAAKGVFEDLVPFLEKSAVLKKDDLIENVLNAYTYNNVLVAIPDCFELETVVGSAAQVGDKMGWSLEEMMAFADEHPQATIFNRTSKQIILQYCLTYNMNIFVDWNNGTCNFDGEEFKRLLEFVNRFPNENDITWEQGQDSEAVRIQKGEVLLSKAYISELDRMQLYIEMFQGPVTCIGYPNMDGSSGCVLNGENAYAIASKSKNKEGAWEFIESYLTRENVRYRWGFPVIKSELDKMVEEALKVEYITDENGDPILDEDGNPILAGGGGGIGYGDWEYFFRIPTREEVDMVLELINVAKPITISDQKIMEIINEETEGYYQGQRTVDDVASNIQHRVYIYVSENS